MSKEIIKNEGFRVKPIYNADPETGIDTEKTFIDNIIGAAQVGSLDISSIDALSQSAQNREQLYNMIDSMAQDDVIAAVLETYAEDTVQTNDKGQVVWVESDDSNVLDYTSWLLNTLNIDKHMYKWAYCLVTYGDVYLRLFRKSDIEEDKLFGSGKYSKYGKKLNETIKTDSTEPENKSINEDVVLRLYAQDDKFIPYVKMVDNPGEMFDLQKFGKTHGYIKAPIRVLSESQPDVLYNYLTNYKINRSDVEVFDAMTFVHGCLEATAQRQPERVYIYLDNNKDVDTELTSDSMTCAYDVKRGQSLLYNSFRIWRELNLLEMSSLLNRLTASAVVRVLNIDVGDMSRNQIQNYLNRLKEKIEQKTALAAGQGLSEYNNPAPIINTIYIPTHEGKGAITATTLGGDFDPKSLVDIEYFRDKLFGSLKVPKQWFGFTEDGAGFNGGTSLTILSSRYGKSIKNLQNILCQMVTDLVNLFLIDRGLDNYVNKFRIRMQEPVTQEEKDKREATDNRIRYIGDLMSQMTDVEDKIVRLKIYKSLISSSVNDPEVMNYLQDYIEKLEKEEEDKNKGKSDDKDLDLSSEEENSSDVDMLANEEENEEEESDASLPSMAELEHFNNTAEEEEKDIINEKTEDDDYLPSPDMLEDFPGNKDEE